jgi:hypothetical protein
LPALRAGSFAISKAASIGGNHVLLLGAVGHGQCSKLDLYRQHVRFSFGNVKLPQQCNYRNAERRLNHAKAAELSEVLAHTSGPVAREGNEHA